MSPTNCIQSVAKRRHSNSCFRELLDSTQAHLLETRMLDRCTASRILSVVYATESSGLYVLDSFLRVNAVAELMCSPGRRKLA